ncbi:activator-dependent family glycosyltransferase [Streptomyces sp. ACA25]|uniref:activator-dependent family glycosyltransferase n=1 Tax=Streptomyces sp. ACA25 TaxID=3022596 RepID=UPI002306E70B|nr:activator-dependent family glycosyltransferase [Streptomyces sp. ACA25]MDB1090149.1 activator-dependent family glycosyltransferase [Streptomyces sp. ACA25]
MRVLFVSHAEKTHFFHMVPMAWSLRTAGHEVRVATQPEMAPAVVETGLVAVPLGADHQWKQVMEKKNDDTWAARVVKAVTSSAELGHDDLFQFFDETTRDYFRTVNNDEFLDGLVGYAREWQPDLIIWEQFSWAGAVAARVTGAAHARMLWGADVVTRSWKDFRTQLGARPADQRTDPLQDWLTGALERHGATFDETVVTGQWTIDPNPPSHRIDNGLPVVGVRYTPYNGPAELPEWLATPPSKPRVALTAGLSVRGYFGFDMLSIGSLHAFADLDIELIATLLPSPGESPDSAPANATVVDFVPMQGLMPTCSAVIHIGGAGVQSTAAYYGVPQLILPGFWDTVVRADLVVESGAGLAVPGHEITAERVRGDLARLLEEPSFREGAAALREDVLSAPSPNEVVPVLEDLTAAHRTGV